MAQCKHSQMGAARINFPPAGCVYSQQLCSNHTSAWSDPPALKVIAERIDFMLAALGGMWIFTLVI